jgi:hypothetical protein
MVLGVAVRSGPTSVVMDGRGNEWCLPNPPRVIGHTKSVVKVNVS